MKKPNGTGTIYKQNDNRRKPYIVRTAPYYDSKTGKIKRKVIGSARTLKEANDILNNYNSKILNIENTEITLKNLFELWKNSEHAKSLETLETYKRYVKDFEDIFNPILNNIFVFLEYNDYQQLLNSFPKTKGKNSLTVLKWMYQYSLKNKITRDDISILLKASNISIRKIDRTIFSDDVVKKLWIQYEKDKTNIYIVMILILFYSGMRTSDILKIKNENIFFHERYLITGSKTKAGKNRIIPLHHKIYPLIKNQYNKNNSFLFENIKAEILRVKFKNTIKDITKNDKGANLHSIRHTFITKMQRLNNVKASLIKTIVGHSHDNVTDDVYTHYSVKDMLAAINKLNY